MKFISLNEVKTAYYASGTGQRDVLFLHGWASSARMWLRSMWALRHQYRMWAPDLPGFGASHIPSIEWCSTENYTDHVATFCDELMIKPYAVIGHSMGGRLAFDLARRYSDRVERVIAISPALTGRLGYNLDVFMLGPLGRALKGISRRVWAVAAASVMSQYWAPRYLTSEAVRRTSNDLRRATWEGSIGSLRAMVRQDYTSYLADVPHPALVICGERDFTIPPDDSRLAARILPDARLLMLKGIHHQPVDECPAEFLSAVQSFLSAEIHPNGRHTRHVEAVP